MQYSGFANKWEFEQMILLARKPLLTIREQMGIRTNGKICSAVFKKSTKWEDFSENVVQRDSFYDQNTSFLKMGIGKVLLVFREQMGIRTNETFGSELLAPNWKMGSHLFANPL